MKQNVLLFLSIVLVLSTTDHAPAPIVEESPKRRSAEPKPKPSPTVKPQPISYAGIWETNFNNELRMSQTGNHVTGVYDGTRGALDGLINGNILSGTWAWKNETGVFRFSLSGDGNSFSGTFSRSNGYTGPWTGVRKSR